MPSESGVGAKGVEGSSVFNEVAAAGVVLAVEAGAGFRDGSGDRAKATAAAVRVANPMLKFRVVLLASGNLAPHFVQVWRVSAFAILHFRQNIGTSTLLGREYSRAAGGYAKDSVRLCATCAWLSIAKPTVRKRE
jgi:hypothetical protein